MQRSLLSFAVSLCFASCAQTPAQNSCRGLALYSWQPRGQPWHYVLVPDEINRPTNAGIITHSPDVMVGETALKTRLVSLPVGQQIAWRDEPPRYALKYPASETRQDLLAFAKQHHVDLQILPTIYD